MRLGVVAAAAIVASAAIAGEAQARPRAPVAAGYSATPAQAPSGGPVVGPADQDAAEALRPIVMRLIEAVDGICRPTLEAVRAPSAEAVGRAEIEACRRGWFMGRAAKTPDTVAFATTPEGEEKRRLARALGENGMAACLGAEWRNGHTPSEIRACSTGYVVAAGVP